MTDYKAIFELLSCANEKGKFAVEIGFAKERDQEALEACFDDELITLIDVSPIAAVPGVLFRIFKLTEKGHEFMKHNTGVK